MDKAIERINCMDHLGKPESTGWKNVLTLLPTPCGRSSVGRASDCGSDGRGFKFLRSPQELIANTL